MCDKNILGKAIISLAVMVISILVIASAIIPGPTGATLGGIQTTLTGAEGVYANGSNIVFNTVVNDQSDNISYNTATGDFTITQPGNYFISWTLPIDGAGAATTISLSVEVNGVVYSTSSSPIVSGILSGEALVTVTTVPTTISLVNTTGEDMFVPVVPNQGNFVITEVID